MKARARPKKYSAVIAVATWTIRCRHRRGRVYWFARADLTDPLDESLPAVLIPSSDSIAVEVFCGMRVRPWLA